jgi:hypothetical protein
MVQFSHAWVWGKSAKFCKLQSVIRSLDHGK